MHTFIPVGSRAAFSVLSWCLLFDNSLPKPTAGQLLATAATAAAVDLDGDGRAVEPPVSRATTASSSASPGDEARAGRQPISLPSQPAGPTPLCTLVFRIATVFSAGVDGPWSKRGFRDAGALRNEPRRAATTG